MMKIRAYTDGACSENPGPGGWGAVINTHDDCVTISGYELETTNNRMELRAVIECIANVLENYKSSIDLEIYSDSAYVVNAINKNWLIKWNKNGWKTAKGDDVKNKDLWRKLWFLLPVPNSLKFIKVKGHSGDTFNELVDKLAREESLKAKDILKKSR